MTEKQIKTLYNLYNELCSSEDCQKEKQYVRELLIKLKLAYYTYEHILHPDSYEFMWKRTFHLESPDNMTEDDKRRESLYNEDMNKQYRQQVSSDYHTLFDGENGYT